MTNTKLKQKLYQVIKRKRELYEQLSENKSNPQVKELMSRVDSEVTAFIAVYDALNGDDVLINTY
jgi:hypothetical protein